MTCVGIAILLLMHPTKYVKWDIQNNILIENTQNSSALKDVIEHIAINVLISIWNEKKIKKLIFLDLISYSN